MALRKVISATKNNHATIDSCCSKPSPHTTGTVVVAVLEGTELPEEQVKNHAKRHLAGYKVPRHILYTQDLCRAPNGKADYKAIREFALKALNLE